GDAGGCGEKAGEIDQRVAAQALLCDRAEDGAVHQDADGDGNEDWAEEPGEKERDARGSYCWHVLSLRRQYPGQVQRVPAVSIGGSLSSLTGAPLGTPGNVGPRGPLSTRAGGGLEVICLSARGAGRG